MFIFNFYISLIKTIYFVEKNNEHFEKMDIENETITSTDWENVTQEDCHWNILISQLEDITFLDSTLKYIKFFIFYTYLFHLIVLRNN